MFEIEYTVSEAEIVKGYNHVHHATALGFLEIARLKYLESIGFPNERFIEANLFLVIAAINITYKREIFAGPIKVTCEEPRITGKSLWLTQRILNQRGKVAVEAAVESKFLSGLTKRSIAPPAEFTRKFVDPS